MRRLPRLLMASIPALAGLSAAGPAAAQSFAPPEGCAGVLTVQQKLCRVTHVWTCEGEAEGLQWVALFDADGPLQVKQVDAEFQWLVTDHLGPRGTERIAQPPPDPESLTELFANGFDSYDFTILSDSGAARRFVGYDRLTGKTVIDGEPLQTTAFGYTVYDGDGTALYGREGRQYVSARHRVFLLGQSWDIDAPGDVRDSSPIEFAYPGDEGFFSLRPLYGCDMMMSSTGQLAESRS